MPHRSKEESEFVVQCKSNLCKVRKHKECPGHDEPHVWPLSISCSCSCHLKTNHEKEEERPLVWIPMAFQLRNCRDGNHDKCEIELVRKDVDLGLKCKCVCHFKDSLVRDDKTSRSIFAISMPMPHCASGSHDQCLQYYFVNDPETDYKTEYECTCDCHKQAKKEEK